MVSILLYLLLASAFMSLHISTAFRSSMFVAEDHPNFKKLDQEHCGFSMAKRIVGGSEAEIGQFPWMVLIGFDLHFGMASLVCGGAIISRYYALTAAHCFDSEEYGRYDVIVVAGITDTMDTSSKIGQTRIANRVHIHPSYNGNHKNAANIHDDIALIELTRPFSFGVTVSPICLPWEEMDLEGKQAYIAGWGTFAKGGGGPGSDVLKFLRKIILDDDDCSSFTRNADGNQLCAVGRPGTAPCSGDSGGPLMARVVADGQPKFVLFGILSYGPAQCGLHAPDVYTRVYHYMPFILNKIQKY